MELIRENNNHLFEFELLKKRTWQGTKNTISDILSNNNKWIFRGHSNPAWAISSSLERLNIPVEHRLSFENDMIREFERKIHFYLSSEKTPTNKIEILSQLQHYGASTRLIDFTSSPYIATFFAFSDLMASSDNACIWAFDLTRIIEEILLQGEVLNSVYNEKENDVIQHENKTSLTFFPDDPQIFEKLIKDNIETIYPISPYKFNDRLNSQKGIFLASTSIDKSFEENLKELTDFRKLKGAIKKIIIPRKEIKKILADLDLMNINHSSLFPGIEGFTQYLNQINVIRSMPNKPF